MSNKRSKRIHKILFGQLAVSVLILFIAGILIFVSQGYRINLKNLKIIKTSVLILKTSPRPDKIFINSQEYPGEASYTLNIPAGYYDISIKKEGYKSWTKTLSAEAEKLYSYEDIKLFLNEPEITPLDDRSKIDLLNSPESSLVENAENNLTSNSYEIWVNNKLVTRFSELINGVKWYSDMKHILYAKDSSIFVMDMDGSNCTELFSLEDGAKGLRFVSGNQGREIYFYNNEKYYRAKIRS